MDNFLEIYKSDASIGIVTRKNTAGKELDLVNKFIDFRKDSFKPTSTKNLAIFLEPRISNAYPDIVFVEYNPNNYECWKKGRFKLENNTLKILFHIYNTKGVSASNLATQLGMPWKDLLLGIEQLYDSELIIRANKRWKVKNRTHLQLKSIQAVEAKLYKWDSVLQQALINQNFASESYVLSQLSSRPKDEVVQKFENFGIGLHIENNNCFQSFGRAKRNAIPISFNSLYFNEWIGRTLVSGRTR